MLKKQQKCFKKYFLLLRYHYDAALVKVRRSYNCMKPLSMVKYTDRILQIG